MKRNRMLGLIAFCLMMLSISFLFQNVGATLEVQDLRVEGFAEGTPEIMHIINHEPVFSWTYEDVVGPKQEAYELKVWTYPNGTGTLMWDTGVRQGNATNVTYNDNGTALPLLDGNDYYVRVRIFDPTIGWTPWNETKFHMNTPPPEPTSPNPPHNATDVPYGPNTTVSWSSGGNDSEGDLVYYFWKVAKDPSLKIIVASNYTDLNISDLFSTSPGQTYYWHVTADDGWEITDSPVWSFTTKILGNVDYILIRDEPNGGGINLCDPANYPSYYKGHTTIFYGATYNHTYDYLGDVPASSTWNSSDMNLVTVTSPGSVSTITCNKTNSGTVTITLDDGEGHTNTTQITVLPDNVDYIQIRDAPGGGGNNLSDPLNYKTYPVGQVDVFYGAAFNHSNGYMRDVPMTSIWVSANTTLVNVTSPGSSSIITCSSTKWGTATIILDDGEGHTNITQVLVMEPTTDYLLIRDHSGGGGLNLCDPVNYKSYPVGASDNFYGTEYNNTAGYIGDVPGTSTWNSSDFKIVNVTSPGNATTVSCNRTNWGTAIITLDDGSGHWNNTEVTVLEPIEDYIQIRDEPNGLGNIVTLRTYIVWETDVFYAAGYNNTAGYLKDVVVNWTSDDIKVGTVTSPGHRTNFTAQKLDIDGTCHVTADYNGITNSTGTLTVLAPTIDFITIVDSHLGAGQWIGNRTYNEGENDIFWAAGFNYTADYVKDVKAAWESNNTIVGKVTYGPKEYTLFTAGWRGGYCRVTATYGTLKNHTGQLYVINVNQLPTARAKYLNKTGFSGGDYSFKTDITLRVNGRKENVITMELVEEGVVVEDVTVTRHSNQPDTKTLSYEIDANKAYEVILNYNGHNGGSNPVIVTFEFLGNTYSVHLLFNSQHKEEQTASIDFNDIVQRVGVIFFDGFSSTDFEGYLVDYYWSFGDGTTANGETLAHSYKENGIYTVTLTVTDDEGGIDSIAITVNVQTIDNNDQCNAAFGQNKEFMNQSGYYAVILQCPADLLITNQENQRIGVFNDSQINTIEGAFIAMLFGEIEVYYVPGVDTYAFEVSGIESGFYDLSIIRVNSGIARKYSIYDVPCSKNSMDSYNFDFKNERFSIKTSEEDIYYSLEFLISEENREDRFQLTNMVLIKAATHFYEIDNWDDLGTGKPVTFSLDEDSDGNIEKSVDLRTGLTGDEVKLLLLNDPVTEPLSPILILMVFGFVFTLGLGIFSTEIARWALLTMFLPLTSRLKKRHMLDHPKRHEIYGFIMGNPGANFGLIKQELDLGNGQLVYHLKQLEQSHLIYSRQDGRRKRFYPMSFSKPKDGMYHLSNIQKKILSVIKNNKGVSQKKIASSIGVSHQVASYHLTKMERWGVVEKEVMGRERRYYISENPVAQ